MILEGYIIIGLICVLCALIWDHMRIMDEHIRKDCALNEAYKHLTDDQWALVVKAYDTALDVQVEE